MPEWAAVALTATVNGLAIGLLLFISAVGLTLIFGMMDVLNLAHGGLFLIGAYLVAERPTWTVFAVGLAAATTIGAVSGGALSLATAPLSRRPHLDQALLTLGIALVIAEGLSAWYGDDVRPANPPPGLDGAVPLFGHQYPTYRLVVIGVGVVLALVFFWLVERTKLGALFRASVADRDMVAAIGIDVRFVRVGVFVVGSALAAVAGFLGGPIYNARPGLDSTILVLALVVVVIGGLGSVRGVLLASLLVGQIESTGRALLPSLASFLLFGALAVTIVARPKGFLR